MSKLLLMCFPVQYAFMLLYFFLLAHRSLVDTVYHLKDQVKELKQVKAQSFFYSVFWYFVSVVLLQLFMYCLSCLPSFIIYKSWSMSIHISLDFFFTNREFFEQNSYHKLLCSKQTRFLFFLLWKKNKIPFCDCDNLKKFLCLQTLA